MQRKQIAAAGLSVLLLFSMTGCKGQSSGGGIESSAVSEPEIRTLEAMHFSADGITQTEERFLSEKTGLTLAAPEGAVIRYTLDGSVPDADSPQYTEPIIPEMGTGDFPVCTVLRAKAFYADGTASAAATHTFWSAIDIQSRFTNLVISVAGDPKEITEGPDGIFFGENVKQRGRESERVVSVEMITKKGELLFAQDAGMRIFGAASRQAALKSMKLYARKSYDAAHSKFAYDGFGTPAAKGDDKVIKKYDRLVLRNAGNDFQFAFIRDELNQTLAKQAGYTDCEAVQPVVVYLNGSYYGFYWLHESICDDLLKAKYGGKGGKFQVIEGREREKTIPDNDPEEGMLAAQFNADYEELAALDLTKDENYTRVKAFLDVENYLNYYAFNICINNRDWPQNNQKLYRYVPKEGEPAGSGPLDGRWHFWIHDTDYAEGLYEQPETEARYNNLEQIMTEDSERYSPLFTKLMQRQDCKEAFCAECRRLLSGVLSEKNMLDTLDNLNSSRFIEMKKYFAYLEELKKTNKDIWIWYDCWKKDQTDLLKYFIGRRAAYMEDFLKQAFPDIPAAS